MVLRVLIMIDILDNGGVTNILLTLLRHIDKKTFNITLLLFNKNDEWDRKVPEGIELRYVFTSSPDRNKNKLIRLSYGFFKDLIPGYFVRKFILKNDYDVNIDFKSNNTSYLVAAKGRKILWNHKDYSIKTNSVERRMLETYGKTLRYRVKLKSLLKAYRLCDQIVCISDYTQAAFNERFGFENKTVVLYNPIDVDLIKEKSQEICQQLKGEGILFCCVSRISLGKGIERLFRAVARLNEEGYVFRLAIVGDGDTYNQMYQLKEKMKLDNIWMCGHQDNPYCYLKQADIFVCPSETEAFSTVLAEAVILEKPIIMTDVGACREVLGNSEYGRIVPNEEEAVYHAMKDFLSNRQHIEHYKNQVSKRSEIFNMADSIKKIENFILGNPL